MYTARKLQPTNGFTMLETLLALSIAAVLLTLGVPAFQNFAARQRMSAAIHTLHSHLALARDAAIRLSAHVIACPGNLQDGCNNGTDWSRGWIVFSDLSGDGQYQPLETVHRIEAGLEQMVIHGSSGRPNLHFFPNGSAPVSNGSITFCDWRGPAHARKLVVSNTGRIRRDEAPGLDDEHCPATVP